MEHDNFKLCGGTLFALLTNAKLNKKRSTFERKGYSEEELMLDLVKIYYPSAHIGDSFKKDTNNYKRCTISDCSSFNFNNQELINSFDYEIKNNYSSKLNQMNELLKHFFDIKNEPVLNKLVRSILELIEKDDSIDKSTKLYVLPNGKPMTKLNMLLSDTFNLASFILGIFHYIIVAKINNELGLQTYEETEQPTLDEIIYETNSNKSTNESKTINVNYQFGRNNFNNIGSLTFIDKD